MGAKFFHKNFRSILFYKNNYFSLILDGLLNSSNERPFVCIELDEPSSERFLSPKGHLDAHSGNYWFWHDGEANFELAIAPTGGELLFELFTETPSSPNEKELDLPPTAIYGTVRQRSFF